jgi:hypothetical protein
MSCVPVLLMAIVLSGSWGCLYPSFYIQGGRGYKEGN